MKAAVRQQLDPTIRSTDTCDFHSSLRAKIVGQEEGVQSLVDMFQVFCAGLNSPGRPVGNLLFLGPTGSGKTRIVEAAAEILFGDARTVIKVDCAEFQHSHAIAKLIGSPPVYLSHLDKPAAGFDEKIERTAVEAARRKFSPEFMNRLDKVVVFPPLRREQLERVLEIELGQVQQRVLETAKGQFLFRVTDPGRDFLLKEGTDQRYGARHLKRAIERHAVYPLANLLATEQVHLRDLVCIDWNKEQDRLTFVREGENLAIPARKAEPLAPARATPAKSGKSADAPGVTLSPEPTPRMAR